MTGNQRRDPVRHAVHLRLPGEGHRLRRRQEAEACCCRRPRSSSRWPRGSRSSPNARSGSSATTSTRSPRQSAKELDLPIIPCNCEGFRGVSQSLGHHISNDTIRDYIIETREFAEPESPYDIALIGDYNIGGDVWSAKPLLEEIGLNVKADLDRRRRDGEDRRHPPGEAEPHPLLPLHELHVQGDGREVRHPLAGVQLLRPDQDQARACAASPSASTTPSRRRSSRSSPSTTRSCRRSSTSTGRAWRARRSCSTWAACVPATPSAPTRTWAWSGRLRLRIRPRRRLRADRPGDARGHRRLRRRLRVRVRAVRPRAQARPGRQRHQGEVPVPEDGDALPADAQLGLLRARTTATRGSRSSPATSTWRSTARPGNWSSRPSSDGGLIRPRHASRTRRTRHEENHGQRISDSPSSRHRASPPEDEARVAAWINTEEYKEKNFARQALVINPAHACQPLGRRAGAPTASRGRCPSCTVPRGAPPTTAPPSTATSASRRRRSPTP